MTEPQSLSLEKSVACVIEQSITFGSHGVTLDGILYLPPAALSGERVPGAVMCHGYGSDKLALENSARELAAEGVAVLTFDFRGHGTSGGKLDGSMVDDVMDAWDYLHARSEIDHKCMGLIGHSMGAFSAILAAGKLKEARVLVTLACPGEISNKIALNPRHLAYPLLKLIATAAFQLARIIYKLKVRADWKKFVEFWPKVKPSQSLTNLSQCSKLFVFCLNDFAAPYSRFVSAYAVASEPKQMMVTTGNHGAPIESESLRRQWEKWTISALRGQNTL